MPPAWGCWRAGRAPWPAHATWPAWRLWARTSQTFAPAAMSARCLSRRARTGGCRWGAWRPRRGKARATGKAPPNAKARSHWTAPERPGMRTTHQGWEDGGQAPARVDGAWQSIVACDGTAASNDQPPAAPVAQATLTPLVQA